MASPTIQFKRGLFVNLPALRAGEPGITTDKTDLYIGGADGNKFFGSHRYWSREDGTNALQLKLVDKDGTNGVSLRSPATVGSNVTYTLPVAPSDGYFLKTNANGDLSWASVSDNATLNNATLVGLTTIGNVQINGGSINATTIGLTTAAAGTFTQLNYSNSSTSGISTVGSLYSGATKVLSVEGGDLTLSNIAAIDATTKATLESVLSLDPNDFDSLNVSGISTLGGDLYANGNVSIGNSSADTLTVNAAATFNQVITGSINGNAATATALQTGRNISVSGIVTGTAYFDGTSNITIATYIQDDVIELGTNTFGDYVQSVTAGGGLTGSATGEASTPTLEVGAGIGITVNADDVALRNATNFTGGAHLKWDSTNGQLTNSIVSDNGSLATVAGGLVVTGDLTVNGTTTQVNTTELAVYDRTITLGIQTGATPADTTWDLGVLMNYGDAGVAKTAGFVWDFATKRFQFAANANNPGVGINTTTPDITVAAFAPIEIGGLWVNNACTGGVQEVIGCANGELNLMNVVVDGGVFA